MRNPEELSVYREMDVLLHESNCWINCREISNDANTFSRRFKHEGFCFLSKTLPMLGKAFDRALSGNENFSFSSSFSKKRKNDAYPKFLGAAFSLVFDNDGCLRESIDPNLIVWIRTFLFYAYKIETPYDEQLISEFGDSFINTDNAVGNNASSKFKAIMATQLADITEKFSICSPVYGPGISSDLPRNDRYGHFVPPSHLRNLVGRDYFHQPDEFRDEEDMILFTYAFLLAFSSSESLSTEYTLGSNDPFVNSYSKVLFVPKDSRGPRVICCEPAYKMKVQQGIRNSLYSIVEAHPRTRGLVNFTDQTVNQNLTYEFDKYCTLDLKEASDRVCLDLVNDVFPSHLVSLFNATRSSVALLPDGRRVTLKKFAPMGNALCFPVLALIAFTSITTGIYLSGGPRPSDNNFVFVYGDDIIVPNEWAQVAIESLTTVGLLVNVSKSYINSQFLESCGQDSFRGTSVNCIKRRKMPTQSRKRTYRPRCIHTESESILHSVSLANSLNELGYKNTSDFIFSEVEKLVGPLPYGTIESSYICKVVKTTEQAWELNESYENEKGEIRAYVTKTGSINVDHTAYSRLRSNLIEGSKVNLDLFGAIAPFDPNKISDRRVSLLRTTLKKWYVGSYTRA